MNKLNIETGDGFISKAGERYMKNKERSESYEKKRMRTIKTIITLKKNANRYKNLATKYRIKARRWEKRNGL